MLMELEWLRISFRIKSVKHDPFVVLFVYLRPILCSFRNLPKWTENPAFEWCHKSHDNLKRSWDWSWFFPKYALFTFIRTTIPLPRTNRRDQILTWLHIFCSIKPFPCHKLSTAWKYTNTVFNTMKIILKLGETCTI